MRPGRLGQRVRRDERPPLPGGHLLPAPGRPARGCRPGSAIIRGPSDQPAVIPRPTRSVGGQPGRRAGREAEHHQPPTRPEQLERRPPDLAAHAVVDQGDAAGLRADLLVPAGLGVVDDEVRRRAPRAPRCVRRGPRRPPSRRPPAPTARAASPAHRRPTAPAPRRRRWAARARRRPGRCGRCRRRPRRPGTRRGRAPANSLSTSVTACSAYPPGTWPRCATTRRPSQVGSVSGPTASTTPATSRPGHGRQLRQRHRPGVAATERGVEQVHAARLDGDPHLAGAGLRGRAARRGRGSSGGPKAWSRIACMTPSDNFKQVEVNHAGRGRGRACGRRPGRRRASSNRRGERGGPVAVTSGKTPGASLLTQWQPVGHEPAHQRAHPLAVRHGQVGRDRAVEDDHGAVRRRLGDQGRAARSSRSPRPAAAGRRGRPRSRAAAASRRSSCSGQTSVSSQAIASASVTSSGFRSMPPRQATSGSAAGSGAGPVTSQPSRGSAPRVDLSPPACPTRSPTGPGTG